MYNIKPTMAIINQIEQTTSLSRLVARIQSGDAPLSIIATVYADILRLGAGVKVASDEIYAEMMHGDNDAVMEMSQAIILFAFPEPKKKDGQPQPNSTKSRGKAGK